MTLHEQTKHTTQAIEHTLTAALVAVLLGVGLGVALPRASRAFADCFRPLHQIVAAETELGRLAR